MKNKLKALVVCKFPYNSKEARARRLIFHEGFNIRHAWKNNLKSSDFKNIDLVISIGGDGTALSASHYLINKPLLAVNSNPKISEGRLTTLTIDKLDKKLDKIKKGEYKIEKLERIEVYINNKLQEPRALNEVFVASEKAYLISKYKIIFKTKNKKIIEEQRSSGLIFSTGTGSTAWFKSAGGKPFRKDSKFIKMVVREPYFGRKTKFSFTKGTIKENDKIEIIPLTNSVLAIDSIREFKLKAGDEVRIKISKLPLFRIR